MKQVRILSPGKAGFDLIEERGKSAGFLARGDAKSTFRHVPDLLTRPGSSSQQVAESSGLVGSWDAVVMPNQQIQIVWLEETGEAEPSARLARLREVHLQDGAWSTARLISEGRHWNTGSLALAALDYGGPGGVLAVWQGRDEQLSYSVGLASGKWTAPESIALSIGGRNWLALCGGRMILVTHLHGNLFWCELRVARRIAGTG